MLVMKDNKPQELIITWDREDIKSQALEEDILLTEDQISEVLLWLDKHENADIGVSWATISTAIEQILT